MSLTARVVGHCLSVLFVSARAHCSTLKLRVVVTFRAATEPHTKTEAPEPILGGNLRFHWRHWRPGESLDEC